MTSTGKPTGPLGLALLAVTGLTGIILAVHGWSARHSGQAPGTLAGSSSSAAGVTPSPSARSAGSSPSAAAPPASGASPAASPGPLLRSPSDAQYSFRAWPRTPAPASPAA